MKINKVWIIDDDKILTYVLKRMLSLTSAFENIDIFENGKDAFDAIIAAQKSPQLLPDIVLLDLNMPVMDGWQFLDEFEKINLDKHITLYIVSSSIDVQDHEKAKNYSVVTDFLVKPIGKKQIEQMISTYHCIQK